MRPSPHTRGWYYYCTLKVTSDERWTCQASVCGCAYLAHNVFFEFLRWLAHDRVVDVVVEWRADL